MPLLLTLCRAVLGVVFLLSSYGKILHPRIFAESLLAYELLPAASVTLVALVVPWLELLAGGAVLLGYRARGGALVLGGLSALFLLVVTSAIWRGLDISCGCFVGVEWARVDAKHVVINLILMLLAGLIYRKGPGRPRAG